MRAKKIKIDEEALCLSCDEEIPLGSNAIYIEIAGAYHFNCYYEGYDGDIEYCQEQHDEALEELESTKNEKKKFYKLYSKDMVEEKL